MNGLCKLQSAALLVLALSACAVQNVEGPVDAITSAAALPEDALLGVSISLLSAYEDVPDTEVDRNLGNLRRAESIHASWQLAQALRASRLWGAVQLTPGTDAADLRIDGAVTQSDGQTLRLRIAVRDAREEKWLEKEYVQVIAEDYYRPESASARDPFQDLYNQIANDLVTHAMARISAEDAREIHMLSRLRFAARFAPEIYQPYILRKEDGGVELLRYPADEDALFARIAEIKLRNDYFLDTVQDGYAAFVARTREPYSEFLRRSHGVTLRLNDGLRPLQNDLKAMTMPGLFTTSLEVPPEHIDSVTGSRTRIPPSSSDRLNRGRQARIYSRFLISSGAAFEEEVAPVTLQFQENRVSLTGSVGEQFEQWGEILREMYLLETDQ